MVARFASCGSGILRGLSLWISRNSKVFPGCSRWLNYAQLQQPMSSAASLSVKDLPVTGIDLGEQMTNLLDRIRADVNNGQLSSHDYAHFLETVRKTRYSELKSIPWLPSDNRNIAFLQMLMNQKLDECLSPVLKHYSFKLLINSLQENINSISQNDCPAILFSLLHLGYDKTEPVIQKLLEKVSVEDLDMTGITFLCKSLQILQGAHWKITENILHKMTDLLNSDSRFPNTYRMKNVAKILLFLNKYVSESFCQKSWEYVLTILKHPQWNGDLDDIAECVRYVNTSSHYTFCTNFHQNNTLLQMAELMSSYFAANIDQVRSRHIAQYATLKVFGFTECQKLIEKRSLDILDSLVKDGSLTATELVRLLFGFTRYTDSEIKDKLARYILDNMDDMDAALMGNLCSIILELGLAHPPLIEAFHQRTIRVFDNLADYFTLLKKFPRVWIRYPTRDPVLREEFLRRIVKLQDGVLGLTITGVSMLVEGSLPHASYGLPSSLIKKLLVILPLLKGNSVNRILRAIKELKRPIDKQLHNQCLDIAVAVQECMLSKVENIQSLQDIITTLRLVYRNQVFQDWTVQRVLMDRLPKFTKNISQFAFSELALLMKQLNYHHAEVFEEMVSVYLADPMYEPMFDSYGDLIRSLANTGYMPSKAEEFRRACSDLLEGNLERDSILSFWLARDLCVLQIYPDVALRKIFTFEYLQNIDAIMTNMNVRQKWHLERMIVELNRSVALECPHLDIPWFCGDYKTEHKYLSQANQFLMVEIEQSLSAAVGGDAFYKVRETTPYHHHIDFECLLDGSGSLAPYSDKVLKQCKELGYERVAIIVTFPSKYCSNIHSGIYLLSGTTQSTIRQLEILGYRVVLVPYYEWKSMNMSDTNERVEYLKDKLSIGQGR